MIPKVAIIILNWNGLEDTIECLESLKKMSYTNYDVIVVDNGSEGNDVEVLRDKYGEWAHIIENDKNYGYAEGNNIGLKYALKNSNPDYILLLNNDVVVDFHFLDELVKVGESDTKIGILGPKIYYYDEQDRINFAGGKMNFLRGKLIRIGVNEIDRGQYDEIKDVDFVEGSAFLIKKRVIEEIGLLDSDYLLYWEDDDWCVRARKAGFKVLYVPRAKLWHKIGISAKKTERIRIYYLIRNRFLFMKKNASRPHLISFLILFLLIDFPLQTGAALLLYKDLSRLKTFYQAVWDGIRLIFR